MTTPDPTPPAMTIVPTTNEWDAPLWVQFDERWEITGLCRREPPADWEPTAWWMYPHAQVFVDGELSKFDADRQPIEGAVR
jgi:hypothetical protein